MNLGENIYRLRTARNLSQGALADALEVSRQSVSKWENNSATPELDKLLKMSEVFGVTLDELVGKEVPVSPAPEPSAPEIVNRQDLSSHRILGIILLCFGLLAFLILTLMGGFFVALPLCLPFIICGIICMTCAEHLLFRCAWALFAIYLPVVILFAMNMIGFRFAITIIAGLLACFAAMIFWTIVGIRKGWLDQRFKKFVAGCVAVLVLVTALSSIFVSIRLANSGLYSDDLANIESEEETYIMGKE